MLQQILFMLPKFIPTLQASTIINFQSCSDLGCKCFTCARKNSSRGIRWGVLSPLRWQCPPSSALSHGLCLLEVLAAPSLPWLCTLCPTAFCHRSAMGRESISLGAASGDFRGRPELGQAGWTALHGPPPPRASLPGTHKLMTVREKNK